MLHHPLDKGCQKRRQHQKTIAVEKWPGNILPLKRQSQLLQGATPPEGLAKGVIIVPLLHGFAVFFRGIPQHQGTDAKACRTQAIGMGIITNVQPGIIGETVFFLHQREGLARGLGQEGVCRGNHLVYCIQKTGMLYQAAQVSSGQVDIRDDQDLFPGSTHAAQPLHQLFPGHQHGLFHAQFIAGDLCQERTSIDSRKELSQQLAHKIRVAGLMVFKLKAGLTALLLLNRIAQILHLFPADGASGSLQLGGDKTGRSRFNQIRIVDAADQKGVKEIKADHRTGWSKRFRLAQKRVNTVTGFPAHGPLSSNPRPQALWLP